MTKLTILDRWFGSPRIPQVTPGSSVWYFKRDKLAFISLLLFIVIVLMAIFASSIAPFPNEGRGAPNIVNRLLPPSGEHFFGTDQIGRDVLSRVLFGAQSSLMAGFSIVIIALVLGTALGAIAGYFGGIIDEVIMRITDVFLAFPPLLLAMVIASVLEPSLKNAILSISLTWWPWYTRLARAQTLSIRENDYVKSAMGMGVSQPAIIRRHILPNIRTPILVQGTLDIGAAILTMASLSFLGLGVPVPTPDWGSMVNEGRLYVQSGLWWLSVFPGLALFITIMIVNLIGDGIQSVSNPHTRGEN